MKIKQIISKIKRNLYLKYITGNIGKTIEQDNKIICYVNKKKLIKKNKKEALLYHYPLRNINNEKICYILENIKLDNIPLSIIISQDNELIIKNCELNVEFINIDEGKCTIDNSKINGFYKTTIIYSKDLIIKNMNNNSFKLLGGDKLKLNAYNNLTIINSNLSQNNEPYLNIQITSNNKLNIINSKIKGKIITINTPILNMDNKSVLKSTNITKIYSEDFNSINITSPTILLNGELVKKNQETIILKKVKSTLEEKRLELINYLKLIKNEINSNNKIKLNNYKTELENKPLIKSIK